MLETEKVCQYQNRDLYYWSPYLENLSYNYPKKNDDAAHDDSYDNSFDYVNKIYDHEANLIDKTKSKIYYEPSRNCCLLTNTN